MQSPDDFNFLLNPELSPNPEINKQIFFLIDLCYHDELQSIIQTHAFDSEEEIKNKRKQLFHFVEENLRIIFSNIYSNDLIEVKKHELLSWFKRKFPSEKNILINSNPSFLSKYFRYFDPKYTDPISKPDLPDSKKINYVLLDLNPKY